MGQNRLLNIFSSVQAAVIILLLIIAASAIGTFLPSYDTYHSWWFILLLSLFWANLLLCTLKRLKLWRTKFSSGLTHIGLLVVLSGALVTCVFGEQGFLIVYKGHTQDTFITKGRRLKELGFKIYLDDFLIEWHNSNNAASAPAPVKNFKSQVTVLEQGREALRKTVEVNRPLQYKGYTLYQASYDRDGFQWSGLDVVKDPGVPFVFAGFILLNAGVILSFYFRP